MAYSNKKYADPNEVIKNIVDSNCKNVFEGQQEDITEVNSIFLECIQEGLYFEQKMNLK